jgi:hypothetical protein
VTKLRGNYYLAYTPPVEAAERRRLAKELMILGATRLHYSFWKITSEITKPVLNLTRGLLPLLLKRSRGIVSTLSEEKEIRDLGTVAIIAYRLPKLSQNSRVATTRVLSELPAMKIGRCLYLVPYLKSSRIGAYKGVSNTYTDLFRLQAKDVKVSHMAPLRIVYPVDQEPLIKAFTQVQVNKIEGFASACRKFRETIKAGHRSDSVGFRKLLSAYRRRYKKLEGLVIFLHKEMGVDLRPMLKRSYPVLLACRALLETEYIVQMLPK